MKKSRGIFLLLSIIIIMLLISLYMGFSYKEREGLTPPAVPAKSPSAPAVPAKSPSAPASTTKSPSAPASTTKSPSAPASVVAKNPGETCSKSYSDDTAKQNAGKQTKSNCQSGNKLVNCYNSQFKNNLTKIQNNYKDDKCFQTFLKNIPETNEDFKNPTECDCDGINIPNTKCTTKSYGDSNICVTKK